MLAAVLALVASCVGVVAAQHLRGRPTRGVVVDARGGPVAGAVVRVVAGEAADRTGPDGRFEVPVDADGAWLTAEADGYLPRTRAARPDDETVLRLAADGPGTVTLAFTGDVMAGRRFFDPDEDGQPDGQLALDADAAAHRRLLDGVAPLLRSADVTVVNLETPLVEDPYPDPTAARPPSFHPTKPYVFASLPALAQGLRDAGVDVVDLGNNHLYDRMAEGVRSTLGALDQAGFSPGRGVFGAGEDVDAAWRPAVVDVDGRRVAFVGCTTVTGRTDPISYVAEPATSARPAKSGAAACDVERVRTVVSDAMARTDVVVMQIHGGVEFRREPSDVVRPVIDAALDAGATLVVDHHPHVVGGYVADGGTLTAETLGNLLFDQTVWPSFEGHVLQVAVRDGQVTSAWVEPIRIQDYRPTGITGPDADWVATGALARSEGPWQLDDGSLWLGTPSAGEADGRPVEDPVGGIVQVANGCAPRAGRDLLWTGDFEDHDLDPTTHGGALWNVADATNPDRELSRDAAASGEQGVRLRRSGGDAEDLLPRPIHRVLVEPGHELSLVLQWRRVGGRAPAAVELAWFNATRGDAADRTVVDLPVESSGWQHVRVDATVPENAIAVGVVVRLQPPGPELAQLDVDDVRLVDWDVPGCAFLRSAGTVVASTAPRPGVPAVEATVIATPATAATVPAALPPAPPEMVRVPE